MRNVYLLTGVVMGLIAIWTFFQPWTKVPYESLGLFVLSALLAEASFKRFFRMKRSTTK